MRLIDVDELNKVLQEKVGSFTEGKLYDVNLCIIKAPTVEAIPVIWLRVLCDIMRRQSSKAAADMLRQVIDLWEREQEAKA